MSGTHHFSWHLINTTIVLAGRLVDVLAGRSVDVLAGRLVDVLAGRLGDVLAGRYLIVLFGEDDCCLIKQAPCILDCSIMYYGFVLSYYVPTCRLHLFL